MRLSKVYEDAEHRLERNEITLGEFERLVDIEVIEPKRGKWIPVKASIYPYGNDVKCSVCGHRMGSSFGYNFCPNCGADMRGENNETDKEMR